MEEIFKGLVERAQYYEQFEGYRNITPSGYFEDVYVLKLKAPAMSIWDRTYLTASLRVTQSTQ